KRFGGDRVKSFMSWAQIPEDEPIEHVMISKAITQAQMRVEGHNFDIRKRVLEYDDVVNRQREVIYGMRREMLESDNLRERYTEILETAIVDLLDEFAPEGADASSWDIEGLYRQVYTIF